jgi:hypothetical protein
MELCSIYLDLKISWEPTIQKSAEDHCSFIMFSAGQVVFT